jgi:hypothetical protein
VIKSLFLSSGLSLETPSGSLCALKIDHYVRFRTERRIIRQMKRSETITSPCPFSKRSVEEKGGRTENIRDDQYGLEYLDSISGGEGFRPITSTIELLADFGFTENEVSGGRTLFPYRKKTSLTNETPHPSRSPFHKIILLTTALPSLCFTPPAKLHETLISLLSTLKTSLHLRLYDIRKVRETGEYTVGERRNACNYVKLVVGHANLTLYVSVTIAMQI